MVISYYIGELKERLIWLFWSLLTACSVVFYFREEYYYVIMKPLIGIVGESGFIYTNVFEVLYGYIYLSISIGLVVLIMMLVYNLYAYIVPGVYENKVKRIEKVIFMLSLISAGLIYIIYKIILTILLKYFYEYGSKNNIMALEIEPRVLENLKYIILIYIMGLLVLLLPIFIMSVYYVGGRDQEGLIKYRGYYYILIIIAIVVIMPPDAILHVLIFGGVFVIIEFSTFIYYLIKEYINAVKV